MTYTIEIPEGFRLVGLEETAKGFRAYLKRRNDASGYLHGAVDLTPQAAIDLCLAEFLAAEVRFRLAARLATPRFTLNLSGLTRKEPNDPSSS